jgi:hypothetical protein
MPALSQLDTRYRKKYPMSIHDNPAPINKYSSRVFFKSGRELWTCIA